MKKARETGLFPCALREFLSFHAFLLAACATTSHVITGKAPAPIHPSQVEIYSTALPEYEEIALDVAIAARKMDLPAYSWSREAT